MAYAVKMRTGTFSYWVAITTTAAWLLLATAPLAATPDDPLLERLRQGGLVIALTASESGTGPKAPSPPPTCTPGTRLTATGWQQAVAIGVGLRKQRIFVELAHAGPGCAARHTAYLVFGADRVRHDPGLAASCDASQEIQEERRKRLATRLAATPPYPRTNLAVIVDACNLQNFATTAWPDCASAPQAGDAIVFIPSAGTPAVPLGCITRSKLLEWSRLPEQFGKPPDSN